MALEVGVETYATVQEADAYITANYISTSSLRTAWTALEEADKEALLRSAMPYIEALPLRGRKYTYGQTLMFPRVLPKNVPLAVVPQRVKWAQIELAGLLVDSSTSQEFEQRSALQRQGVKEFQLGTLKEVYGTTSTGYGFLPTRCLNLLDPWLRGGFDIVESVPESGVLSRL
jgi:hypothetical protein